LVFIVPTVFWFAHEVGRLVRSIFTIGHKVADPFRRNTLIHVASEVIFTTDKLISRTSTAAVIAEGAFSLIALDLREGRAIFGNKGNVDVLRETVIWTTV